MIVLIGTKNETKIKGAKCALDKYFNDVELIGVDVSSGVASQQLLMKYMKVPKIE